MNCPTATYDIKFNLKNRNWAIKNVDYGPANPEEDNEEYWQNLAAFIQTPEMLDCILKGIDEETDGFAKDVQGAANLGYCELFDFKCAGERTCSAWLSGGPITKKMTKNQQNMLMMAKTEYDIEDES
jgi:hypothetical protein